VEITLKELLDGKATIIKTKDYLSTKEYVQPFLDQMSKFTNNFKIKVKLPDQMTTGDSRDTTYNRVLVEAILPATNDIDKHQEVVGLLYGLDTRKPIAKVYRGYQNQACLNLTVFQPKWMEVKEVKPKEGITFDAKALMEAPSFFEKMLQKLKGEFVDPETLHTRLGKWVDVALRGSYYNGVHNVRVSPSLPIEAYTSLYVDPTSQYYVQPNTQASMFDVYNAFTQIITDDTKDFINQFEKTMMVNTLLEVK
jgi:hypothetical protein